jgi:N-acetylmuramoyl-L-alanine amidase CwlA
VNDPRLLGVVQHTDPNGKRRPMTVAETSVAVKSTDDWWKTNNANEEVGKKMDYIGKLFGRTV